jgi:hypothetical protein
VLRLPRHGGGLSDACPGEPVSHFTFMSASFLSLGAGKWASGLQGRSIGRVISARDDALLSTGLCCSACPAISRPGFLASTPATALSG